MPKCFHLHTAVLLPNPLMSKSFRPSVPPCCHNLDTSETLSSITGLLKLNCNSGFILWAHSELHCTTWIWSTWNKVCLHSENCKLNCSLHPFMNQRQRATTTQHACTCVFQPLTLGLLTWEPNFSRCISSCFVLLHTVVLRAGGHVV